MQLRWLLPVLMIACGKGSSGGGDDADAITAQVKQRFAAMVAAIEGELPACTSKPPREGPVLILYKTLVEIAGGDPLAADDPNRTFVPTNYESQLVGQFNNRYNPKSSTVQYGKQLLATTLVVVVKIDKFDRYQVTSSSSFNPGTLHVRTIQLDGSTGAARCVEKYTVKNGDEVFATYFKGGVGPSKEDIEKALEKDMNVQFSLSGPKIKRY